MDYAKTRAGGMSTKEFLERVAAGEDTDLLLRKDYKVQHRIKVQLMREDEIIKQTEGAWIHESSAKRAFKMLSELVKGEDLKKIFDKYSQKDSL